MKILESFDTKLDIEELNAAFEKYGEGNVILIKRHRVKLILPLALVILSLFVLATMLYIIYINTFESNKRIFWILTILYVYVTISRCFFVIVSIIVRINYWVSRKKQYTDTPSDNLETKQKGLDKFLKRTLITFTIHLIVIIFNALFPFLYINETGKGNALVAIGILLINFLFLYLMNRVMYLLIEYEMSFNICTKDGFTNYKQDGFFKTDSINISSSTIKVIKSSNEGLSGALFQYGNLYIYTDGDLNTKGGKNLELTFIPTPSTLSKKLNSIIKDETEVQSL